MAAISRSLLLALLCLAAPNVMVARAVAQEAIAEPYRACDAAAARAERDWNVPAGVLAAVGAVESGRSWSRIAAPLPWPWTINADGRGYYLPSKAAAIATAASLLAQGARFVDVGCFQVDLAFHGRAFASLEDAFDPQANAQAAARILVRGRFGDRDWSGAVARYHSASPVRGGLYLRQVQAALAPTQSRVWSIALDESGVPQTVVLLSPQARLVRVLTGADSSAGGAATRPRLATPRRPSLPPEPQIIRLVPAANLPVVLRAADRQPELRMSRN